MDAYTFPVHFVTTHLFDELKNLFLVHQKRSLSLKNSCYFEVEIFRIERTYDTPIKETHKNTKGPN